METHPKKKIEIVVETPMVKRVLAILKENGATGVTVLPAVLGEGHGGAWSDRDLSTATNMQMVFVITGPRRAEKIIEALFTALSDYKFMIATSDVQVIRNDYY